MIILPQPAGEPAGIIRKYYPNLGEHLPSPTWPALAAEWYSALTRVDTEELDWYVFSRHERASDKEEFRACVAMLLAETEQHAHLPGYGYKRHDPPADLTPQRVAELDSNGQEALRAVREWHTFAMLSPIEQFLYRARKIELWQNEQQQLATREARHQEWREEYAVLLLALRRAIPTAKKRLLRAAYTELNQLLPTLQAGRPLEWQRLYDGGHPFFSSALTATYTYSEFNPLRPTRDTTNQITEPFFQHLHVHLSEKEWHVWQALILLAGALGEAAPPTPETFQGEQTVSAPAPQPLDTPADKSDTTIADLCRPPFAPPNLRELLVLLKVVDTAGACLTNALEGKAQGLRGGFTAAYRVLHRAGLLKPAPDKDWAAAFALAYGATLGKAVISHKLTAHGIAPATAPRSFAEATDTARQWAAEWQSRH